MPVDRLDGAAVTLHGSFNPRIFQPAWLDKHGLVAEDDVSTVELVDIQFARVTTPWVTIVVVPERLDLRGEPSGLLNEEQIRDLAVGTMRLLPHSRVDRLAIDHWQHRAVVDPAALDALGHALVPKDDLWREVLQEPGTATVQVQGERPDQLAGSVVVTVQPSKVLQPGLFVLVRDELTFGEDEADAATASRMVDDGWEAARTRATVIMDAVMGRLDQ